MKIGIDLDDTLVDFSQAFIRYYNRRYSKNFKKEQLLTYKFRDIFKISKEEERQAILDFYHTNHFDNLLPLPGSIEAIELLKTKNELYIITARWLEFTHKTKLWIKKHFPNSFKGVYFARNYYTETGPTKTKTDVCLDLSLDFVIEDSWEYAKECATREVKVILFDQPWNRNSLLDGMARVYNWGGVLMELSKLIR